jgi:hypothetical protein
MRSALRDAGINPLNGAGIPVGGYEPRQRVAPANPALIPGRVGARSTMAVTARPGRLAGGPVHRTSGRNRFSSCFASNGRLRAG